MEQLVKEYHTHEEEQKVEQGLIDKLPSQTREINLCFYSSELNMITTSKF